MEDAGSPSWLWQLFLAVVGGGGLFVLARWAWREFIVRFHVFQVRPFDESRPLRVVVSPLLSDDEGRQTEHVSDALVEHLQSGKPGSPCDHVLLKGAVQRTRFGKQSFEGKIVAERIQSYLRRLNADMMVWGYAAGPDKALHLTVTPRA